MSTNKVALRSVEEIMSGYTPIYQPIYPLFLGKSQSYSEEVGKLTFKRQNAVADIRAKHLTPKDTEIRQLSVSEGSKNFKKYFLANQYQISQMQGQESTEDVVAQVLDEHQKHMDELFLLGEGTSESTMINNGLFWSDDPNYTLESSAEIALSGRLYDFHTKVLVNATKANRVSGRKVIMFYGTSVLPLFNSLYDTAVKPFKVALAEVLGSNYSLVEMPAEVTPSAANGWIIANLDQVKLHYTSLPSLHDRGSNDEKMYNWFNFLMGSSMLEVLATNGIVRQPATLGS